MNPDTITIGCDPEFFLYSKKERVFVSAHDKIPGTKKEPHKLENGACQVDGLACEFNIDPAKTPEEFEHNIISVLKQLRRMIPREYAFSFIPCVRFPRRIFDLVPAEAKELGCNPDFSAIKMTFNTIPDDIDNLRTGSGHIHIGWTENADTSQNSTHFNDCVILSQQMGRAFQYYEGWLAASNNLAYNASQRHQYYGMDYAFRPKPYGVEYRGLSNLWVNYPGVYKEIFNHTKDVFRKTLEGQKTTDVKRRSPRGNLNRILKDAG